MPPSRARTDAAAHGSYACADVSGPRAGPRQHRAGAGRALPVVRRDARARFGAAERQDALRTLRRRHHRPRQRRRARPRLRRLVPPRRGALLGAAATRCCAARAAASRGASTRSRPPGPVLDVGSGDGALLDALAARGRSAVGLERDSARPDVRSGDAREIEGAWAAIVLWHALEHLRDAGRGARPRSPRCSRPAGVMVIAMPNPDSLQARAFGDRWLALDLPRHLVHVPAAALLDAPARARAADRARQPPARRPGRVRLAARARRLAARAPRPLRRDPPPRGAQRPMPAGRRARDPRGRRRPAAGRRALALAEAALRRGGSVYVEARRV